MSNTTPVHDLVDLANEDVKILYDIINAAEQSSQPPIRALFTAYEQVLTRHGIAKENDQIYLRFLLRMGENRKEGRTLFEQFETLLSQVGIQVSFDDEQQGRQTAPSVNGSYGDTSSPSVKRFQTRSFRPARRNSLESAINSVNNTQHADHLPLLPPRPRSLDDPPKPARPHNFSQRISDPPMPPRRSAEPLPAQLDRPISKYGAGLATSVSDIKSLSSNIERALATAHSSQAPQSPHGQDGTASDGGCSQSADEDVPSETEKTTPAPQEQLPLFSAPKLSLPSDSQLEEYAGKLRFHHMASKAIALFRHWRTVTEQAHNQHLALMQSAQARDAKTLKRQAFDQWRTANQEEHQLRETEKFYQALELRASKARSLFLLTKAFTHWAQCASEEVLRKTAAKKHILVAKYFNAWRDITAVNDIKVRRQGLTKYLSLWKNRTSHVLNLDRSATDFRVAHSANQAYRQWFWHFCERRAPSWYTSKLSRALFTKWRDGTRAARIRLEWARDFRNLELLRNCIVRWTERSNDVQEHLNQAFGFRQRTLLLPKVEALQRELRLAPLHCRCVRLVDSRVTRRAWDAWSTQARAVSQARRLDEMRLLRNSWTTWNDTLLCRALQRRTDDRITVEALYKWVLAERLALCERVRTEKLARLTFSRWQDRTNQLSTALGKAHHFARAAHEKRIILTVMRQWSSSSAVVESEAEHAQRLRGHRLMSQAFKGWAMAGRHNMTIEKWASDARFYMLTSKAIESWRGKVVESKKAKRKEAYAKTRRRIKMSLARDVLQRWRQAAQQKQDLRRQAEEADRERLLTLLFELFANWQARSIASQETALQASTLYNARLLQSHLRTLRLRHEWQEDLSAQAQVFSNETGVASATTCLRKINWQLFQAKRLHESAESLADRNRRRHFRGMLRNWADTTSARRAAIDDLNTRTGSHQLGFERLPSDAAAVAEQWTPLPGSLHQRQRSERLFFGTSLYARPSLDAAPTVASIAAPIATPAYLRTPSRHLSKARSTRLDAFTQPLPAANHNAGSLHPRHGLATGSVRISQAVNELPPSTPGPLGAMQPQTQPRQATQITPFMSRLRAQYAGQAPSSAHPFARSSRFRTGTSALRRDLGASLLGDRVIEDDDGAAEDTNDPGQAGPPGGVSMFDAPSEDGKGSDRE